MGIVYILKRLKSIFDEMDFLGSECAIDSLMRIDCDHTNCTKCQYALCDIEDEGMICEIELIDELSGVV